MFGMARKHRQTAANLPAASDVRRSAAVQVECVVDTVVVRKKFGDFG
jgi:hypothetical protein